jgi:alginate O-acetyltransferase complex protein AlgI
MLFNSYPFLFSFLPITLIGYYSLNHFQKISGAKIWLVLASLFFYSYASLHNLPLLLASIGVNFLLAQKLQKTRSKPLFQLGLAFNLGLLGFFKYANFAVWNVNFLFQLKLNPLVAVFPLGLSFYTLQQIAFLVDAYEGLAEEKGFLDYAVFVSFFPQLISGPIVHYSHLMPQIENRENKRFHVGEFSTGLFLLTVGLVKKVLISEAFRSWSAPGFDESSSLDLLAAWKTSLSYAFQLYFDFSGYTDMAIGIGHMFNVQLPQNFNSPFRSKSIIEFWTRWHITLSQFINTYVFAPMLRAMPKMTFRNTMIATFTAMFLAGVWHGAGWTFVIYGVMHGLALVVNHKWKKNKKKKKLPGWMAWLLTFNFVNLTFVMFRAKTVSDALKVYRGMFGLSGVVLPKIGIKKLGILDQYGWKIGSYLYPNDYFFLAMLIGTSLVLWKAKNSLELEKSFTPTSKLAVLCGFAFVLCFFGMNRITEFIYFNF